MKLVTFMDPDGTERIGVVEGDGVRTIEGVPDMRALFQQGIADAPPAGGPEFELSHVKLRAPIRRYGHDGGEREHLRHARKHGQQLRLVTDKVDLVHGTHGGHRLG